METSISSITEVLTEAVGTDSAQTVFSACRLFDVFDDCLEHVLQRGVPRGGLHTQLMARLTTPRSDAPVRTLYRQLLEGLGPDDLAYHLLLSQHRITERGRGKIDPIAEALLLFSTVFTQSGHQERTRQLLLSYLLEGCAPEALQELGLVRNIQDDEDRLFILDTVLLCMLGQKAKIGTNGEIGPHSRVYLLLDEAEHVLALSKEACWAFTGALEHLAKEVGAGLTIWLNCATTDEQAIRQVQQQLGTRFLREWATWNLLEVQEE